MFGGEEENTLGFMQSMDNDSVPSFLQEDSEVYLKYMSPPRTTTILLVFYTILYYFILYNF